MSNIYFSLKFQRFQGTRNYDTWAFRNVSIVSCHIIGISTFSRLGHAGHGRNHESAREAASPPFCRTSWKKPRLYHTAVINIFISTMCDSRGHVCKAIRTSVERRYRLSGICITHQARQNHPAGRQAISPHIVVCASVCSSIRHQNNAFIFSSHPVHIRHINIRTIIRSYLFRSTYYHHQRHCHVHTLWWI